jgi:DNA-binding transcriptional LysR family regulator
MEIKWLKDFLVLSNEGNFRVAANLRHVSQPAFSRRIQALEAWIGAPLIDRGNQPSQLTEAGKIFLPVAQQIVDLANAGKDSIQAQGLQQNEKITFATLGALAQGFLPAWLKKLRPLIAVQNLGVRTEYNSIDEYFGALECGEVYFFVFY